MKRFPIVCLVVSTFGLVGTISAAEAAMGDVLKTHNAPGHYCSGLGWDGTHIWIGNQATATWPAVNRVSMHDPWSLRELSGFEMGNAIHHGLTFDNAGAIYSDNMYDEINKLSRTGQLIKSMEVDGGEGYAVAYVAAPPRSGRIDRLFQMQMQSPVLFELNPDTAAVMRTQPLSVPDTDSDFTGIAWDGSRLWITDQQHLYRVDVDTGELLATMDRPPGPGHIEGVAFDGKCLWLSDTRSEKIYVVDHGQPDLEPCTLEPPPPDAGLDGSRPSDLDASPFDAGTHVGSEPSPSPVGVGDAAASVDASAPNSGTDWGTPPGSAGCSCDMTSQNGAPAAAFLAMAVGAILTRVRYQRGTTNPRSGRANK